MFRDRDYKNQFSILLGRGKRCSREVHMGNFNCMGNFFSLSVMVSMDA